MAYDTGKPVRARGRDRQSSTFREMVELISGEVGAQAADESTSPPCVDCREFLSIFVRDVMLTPEEVDGLMAGLLVSKEPPLCKTRLGDRLEENKKAVGAKYASELQRGFSTPHKT